MRLKILIPVQKNYVQKNGKRLIKNNLLDPIPFRDRNQNFFQINTYLSKPHNIKAI